MIEGKPQVSVDEGRESYLLEKLKQVRDGSRAMAGFITIGVLAAITTEGLAEPLHVAAAIIAVITLGLGLVGSIAFGLRSRSNAEHIRQLERRLQTRRWLLGACAIGLATTTVLFVLGKLT
jgi:hypothetical protein